MANKEWNLMFSNATYSVLAAVKLDHSPLHVTKQKPSSGRKRKGYCFRYEAAWYLSEECQRVVAEGWKSLNFGGNGAGIMRHKLESCQKGLQKWQQGNKLANHKATKQALDQIRHIQQTGTGSHIPSMIQLQKKVENSMAAEELKWRQRGKQHWLQFGDRNTRYFHLHASQRRRTNTIGAKVASERQAALVTVWG
ncbi:uncharacterized protein LOC122316148 [Carya illinoinensis]|uniref:uncharacterized protein LOC122316148 n=1 Tax=Carya illinoinensis TaxID=32201 RepID=UPI001C719B83|nr:uncharacterized protein LOC122316148 [Carya illinoinensis]